MEEQNKKLEYLKREEIRTMAKDVAKLREEEARTARERIAGLKTKEEARKERGIIEIIRKMAREKRGKEMEKIKKERRREGRKIILPRRLSGFEKIFIRGVLAVLLILIIASIIAFWYWYFAIKKASSLPPASSPAISLEEEMVEKEEVVEKREPIIPPSLILVETTETLKILFPAELPDLISQTVKKDLEENRFTRIIIENTTENKILGLKEFFESFAINPPENFYSKINNDFTLFVYSSKGVNRFGFIAKAKTKEGLLSLFQLWEETMEKDFETLFAVLGKEEQTPFPYFKTAAYKEVVFHYLSFSQENFGILWALTDDYLIFTSSGESMLKVIDKLKI